MGAPYDNFGTSVAIETKIIHLQLELGVMKMVHIPAQYTYLSVVIVVGMKLLNYTLILV